MDIFTGTLSIISNQSSLNGDLLLKAGIPDMAQAMFAATQFLVKIRHLNSGQFIQVTGDKAVGFSAIIMQDAQASPLGVAAASGFDAATAEKDLTAAFTELNVSPTKKNKIRKKTGKAEPINTTEKKPTKAAKKHRSDKKDR